MSLRIAIRLSVRKPGAVGPVTMFLTPNDNSVSRMTIAFCSNHDSTRLSGSSLTEQPRVSASLTASMMAE
ncbi:hypothetical protein D3C78_1960390 [compost metagenome]